MQFMPASYRIAAATIIRPLLDIGKTMLMFTVIRIIVKNQLIEMIEQYTTGSHMTVQGTKYYQDLKIIQGQVKGNWWRKEGHRLAAEDIADILSVKPEILVVGTGYAGEMQVPMSLRTSIEGQDIEVIAERTSDAVEIFNRLFNQGKDVAGAFHLTC
jgi:hypothetical protein